MVVEEINSVFKLRIASQLHIQYQHYPETFMSAIHFNEITAIVYFISDKYF